MLSEHLSGLDRTAEIGLEPLSDHECVSIQIDQSQQRKGPGIWRFDYSLLTNTNFVERILEMINEVGEEEEPQDPGSRWEWMKYKIHGESIKFAK